MRLSILMILSTLLLAGCMTVNINNYADGAVCVKLDKTISTLPVKADGNTVPVSAVP